VNARFVNAPAELNGELQGTLHWELRSAPLTGVGLMTSRFELSVSGERFSVTLEYHRGQLDLRPGFTAKGRIAYHGTGKRATVRFAKSAKDELFWMRSGGPHRLQADRLGLSL
jgi:hypothetical protein